MGNNKMFYSGEMEVKDAICSHCGKIHDWDAEICDVYKGKLICEDCFQNNYGYCNECHKLYKYEDMNEDIICKECENK